MTAAFFVAAVLINVVLRDNKQTYAVLEESAMGSTTVVVEFVVTVAFGSSVCSNCICYLLEVHKGKKRQHDDMVWQAFIWHDRKNEYIGTFLFPEEAAAAYDKRARVRRQPPRHHDALAPLYSPSLISRVAPITLPTMYHPCVRCRVI